MRLVEPYHADYRPVAELDPIARIGDIRTSLASRDPFARDKVQQVFPEDFDGLLLRRRGADVDRLPTAGNLVPQALDEDPFGKFSLAGAAAAVHDPSALGRSPHGILVGMVSHPRPAKESPFSNCAGRRHS